MGTNSAHQLTRKSHTHNPIKRLPLLKLSHKLPVVSKARFFIYSILLFFHLVFIEMVKNAFKEEPKGHKDNAYVSCMDTWKGCLIVGFPL